jgi:cytochrome P450
VRHIFTIVIRLNCLQTVSSVVTFVLAMVLYPDVQKKAQVEIDAIVGQERLPIFTDYQRLPYVQAIILEALRWIPVLPLGASSRSSSILTDVFSLHL